MANEESRRYLLQIEVSGHAEDTIRIHYMLLEETPYPPAPRAGTGRIDLHSYRRTLGEEWRAVPDVMHVAAQFPEGLGNIDALRDQAWVERVGAEWTETRLHSEMVSMTELVFSGSGRRLLDELMDRSAAAYERGPWLSPRPVVTVSVQDPVSQRVPWELMNLEPGTEQRLWLQCAILRRTSRPAGEHSVPFHFPLRVSVLKLAEAAQHLGWASDLFDEFTERTRPLGGFEWEETGRDLFWDPLSAPVQHIVFSSGDGLDFTGFFPAVSGDRSGLEQLLSVLERYGLDRDPRFASVSAREPLRPPRLLVLHDVASQFSAHLASALVHAGLDFGADAVLVVSFEGTQAGEDRFFPTFYRKLMHNWPLEQGLLAALQEADARQGTLPTGWAFGAREGGELHLLLPRPVLEAAQPAMPPPPPKSPVPSEGRAPRGSRQARVAAELRVRAEGALERQRGELLEMAARVPSGIPESEEHFVGDVVRHAESVRSASESHAWSRDALDLLERADDRSVQQATVRLTNLWLTEELAGEERTVDAGVPLTVQAPYMLHLLIAPRAVRGAIVEAFPEETLAELFKTEEWLTLDVALFSPSTDFTLERRRAELRLPRVGASDEVRVGVRPQRVGVCRLRVCIYYGNLLLQSLLLEAEVTAAEAESEAGRREGTAVTRVLDYVASADLALLSELPQPDLSLFTNQVSDGTHWIGVYASDGETGLGLASGDTIALDSATLDTMTREVRKLLGEIEGLKEGRRSSYNYAKPLAELGEAEVAWRETQLIRLACQGSRLFENLLIAAGMEPSREDNLWDKLQRPGIISIARCRGERPSLPWAVLYEQYLDTGREQEMSLCRFYQAELARRGTEGAGQPGQGTDLLQDPQSCRERENCPLDGAERELTVCPFGFWGFLHQVEQPLQDIDPLPVGARDETPEELGEARRNQTSRLAYEPSGPLEALMAVWPGFPDAEEHWDEIKALFTEMGLAEPNYLVDREEILPHLQQGGKHLYYFFCHGEMQGAEFRLKLGPTANPGYISASNLSRRVARWPQVPQPLVILNGCETMALLAERIHLFASALRRLGACGVIGTEIEVFTGLARVFGQQVLGRFLAGDSLGEAFLEARKELMGGGNPLGLAYTCLAPVSLHLHDEEDCAWCEKHGLDQA
jgi:hypothetical protein